MIYLLYVIYLYHDYTDRLVVGVVVDLGNVPIVGEEDEELVGIAEAVQDMFWMTAVSQLP